MKLVFIHAAIRVNSKWSCRFNTYFTCICRFLFELICFHASLKIGENVYLVLFHWKRKFCAQQEVCLRSTFYYSFFKEVYFFVRLLTSFLYISMHNLN